MDSSKYNSEQFALSQQTNVLKSLLIQCLQTSEIYQYPFRAITYDSQNRQLDIGKVLTQIFIQILLNHYEYHVFYFNTDSGYFHFGGIYPFKQKLKLGEDFIVKDQIIIAFRKSKLIHFNQLNSIHHKIIDNENQMAISHSILYQSSMHHNQTQYMKQKKKRVNDRTIYQILQKVSQWRNTCEAEKITYQQAAKYVNIPKKTLDDYYSLIRFGQQYQFNFQNNLHQKIGVLRQYVREIQKKKNIEKKASKQINQNISIIDKIIISLQPNKLYNKNIKSLQ